MGSYSRRGSELLDTIEDIIIDELQRGTETLGGRVTTRIAIQLGGQQVYFPFDKARRDARIYDEFTGDNVHELAERFRLSSSTVYDIIRNERAKRRHKQLALPGLRRGEE